MNINKNPWDPNPCWYVDVKNGPDNETTWSIGVSQNEPENIEHIFTTKHLRLSEDILADILNTLKLHGPEQAEKHARRLK